MASFCMNILPCLPWLRSDRRTAAVAEIVDLAREGTVVVGDETFEDGVSISTFLMDDAHTASIDAAIQAALGAKLQAEGVAKEEAAARDKKRTKLEIRGDGESIFLTLVRAT